MKYKLFHLLIMVLILSCSSNGSNKKSVLYNYDFENPKQFTILSKLNEISGITITKNQKILAINDEIGIIFKIEPLSGEVISAFSVGIWTIEGDFEGITTDNDFIYVISSSGKLYKFKEGKNNSKVNYEVEQLPFSSRFDLEGLYYDKDLNGLLITPKEYPGKKFKGKRTIYFYSFIDKKIISDPIIEISLKKLKKDFGVKSFYPSGITKHPVSNNYLIISAKDDNVIIEVDIKSNIIGVQKLSEKLHRQPEGITILDDNSIIISDEASGKKPKISRYIYKP